MVLLLVGFLAGLVQEGHVELGAVVLAGFLVDYLLDAA